MAKLRVLSGSDVVAIFNLFGFAVASQKGSHIKLVRVVEEKRQSLTVPNHKEIDKGTLKAIIRQACVFIPESELNPHVHHEQ